MPGKPAPRLLGIDECIDIALQNNRNQTCLAVRHRDRRGPIRAGHVVMLAATGREGCLHDNGRRSHFHISRDIDQHPIYGTDAVVPPRIDSPEHIPPIDTRSGTGHQAHEQTHNAIASLNLTYPIYTGGLRKSIVRQARQGIQAAREEARRTDLQVVYDVKRMY
ncbi:MAG: TolC family protein [Desulfobacterales bacterium]|nr:TolC family protein [Desulfobacterales bacterium]